MQYSINIIIMVFLFNVNKATTNKYCSLQSNGEPKYFICARNEYCCTFGCCVHLAFQFYQLWYYWLLLIFMFMVCSGGSWWYRFCRHQESSVTVTPRTGGGAATTTAAGGGVILNGSSSGGGGGNHQNGQGRIVPSHIHGPHHSPYQRPNNHRPINNHSTNRTNNYERRATIIRNNGLNYYQGIRNGGPPPNYYTAAVVRYHSASELETRRNQNLQSMTSSISNRADICPYYQLYGPPPSYDSVVRLTTANQFNSDNTILNNEPSTASSVTVILPNNNIPITALTTSNNLSSQNLAGSLLLTSSSIQSNHLLLDSDTEQIENFSNSSYSINENHNDKSHDDDDDEVLMKIPSSSNSAAPKIAHSNNEISSTVNCMNSAGAESYEYQNYHNTDRSIIHNDPNPTTDPDMILNDEINLKMLNDDDSTLMMMMMTPKPKTTKRSQSCDGSTISLNGFHKTNNNNTSKVQEPAQTTVSIVLGSTPSTLNIINFISNSNNENQDSIPNVTLGTQV